MADLKAFNWSNKQELPGVKACVQQFEAVGCEDFERLKKSVTLLVAGSGLMGGNAGIGVQNLPCRPERSR